MIFGLIKNLFGRGKDGKGIIEQGTDAYAKVRGLKKVSETLKYTTETQMLTSAQQMDIAQSNNRKEGWINDLMEAFKALPRPLFANSTWALLAYAMYDPVGFEIRMNALNAVPERLWWLFGAVITFYFGARESYKMRADKVVIKQSEAAVEMAKHNAEAARHQAQMGGSPSVATGNAAIAKIKLE